MQRKKMVVHLFKRNWRQIQKDVYVASAYESEERQIFFTVNKLEDKNKFQVTVKNEVYDVPNQSMSFRIYIPQALFDDTDSAQDWCNGYLKWFKTIKESM